MSNTTDITPTRQPPSKPLFYHTSSPYRWHAATTSSHAAGQHTTPQTAPWRETVGGPLGELLRAAASSPQHSPLHNNAAAHPVTEDEPPPPCSRPPTTRTPEPPYTKEGMHLQQIAQLKHQLQVALQQRDDAARVFTQQQADWEVAQHAQHEQTRQQLEQLQQQADAAQQTAVATLQHQLDQCTAQRDDAQRHAHTLQRQLQEQTSFLERVLVRFQGAVHAVQRMEQHCCEIDARMAAQQQEWGSRLEEERGRHAQVLQAVELQHEGEMQHAALRLEKAVQEAQQAGQQAVRAVQDKAHGEVQRLTRELEVLRDAQAGVVVEYEGRLSRMAKHASDSQRTLEQRCAGLIEAVEGKTAALKVAQQQAAEYASEVERLRRKMKKCIAAIKALEQGRQQLEAAVHHSTTQHHELEAAAASHKAQHDAKDAMLQSAVQTAAALHQRLALVEQQLAQQQQHRTQGAVMKHVGQARQPKAMASGSGMATTEDGQSCSSPRIAAVYGGEGLRGGSQQSEVLGGAEVVCENPLFAAKGSTRAPSSVAGVSVGRGVGAGGECASPASRAASATLSNIALKLQELQRHLQSTPPLQY